MRLAQALVLSLGVLSLGAAGNSEGSLDQGSGKQEQSPGAVTLDGSGSLSRSLLPAP